ncbi:MAG: sulfite exporter TauE/SafE family protein [Actinomycetota bacterium]|nr:sulfite exporter TauE/SafE family protein [Actinomycetota bacterium]
MSVEIILLVVAAGVLVGVLSAMFGVGGGVLMVPFMVFALEETQHLAEGTSLLVIVPTAIAGVVVHRRSGFVSFRHSALLGLGGIGGAWLGAMLALRLPAETLQFAFGTFMAIVGVRTVARGIKQMKAERPGHGDAAPGAQSPAAERAPEPAPGVGPQVERT